MEAVLKPTQIADKLLFVSHLWRSSGTPVYQIVGAYRAVSNMECQYSLRYYI